MGFKIGDKAVYAAHGIGEVTGIELRQVSGRKFQFYVLKLLGSGITVWVPTDKASTGLRGIIPRSDVKKVLELLGRKKTPTAKQTWNRRHREYMDKLKSGSVFQVAEVLRELTLLGSQKNLSYSEQKVLQTARSLLVCELAIAKRTKESHIERELDAIFG